MSSTPLQLPKYTIGVGDRFALQGEAQLRACVRALESGVEVVPVWNKSNREHLIVGSEPLQTRQAADSAVRNLGWNRGYFLDADHIGLKTVDRFLAPCDFFTIDVADKIGSPAGASDIRKFVDHHPELMREMVLEGSGVRLSADRGALESVARQYLTAVQEAGKIYRYIAERKGAGQFIPEISMDETDSPQTPLELLIILVAIADEKVPIQTIAPKFLGRFNKGVDYRGDIEAFTREFTADLAVVAYAVRNYGLPQNLKLSVHSGSDKFSIYRPIQRAITDAGAGLHLKTAGTTWLAELAGLALAGGEGLEMAKEIYFSAREHMDELCAPYASVIEIDGGKLPPPAVVERWNSQEFFDALNHDSNCHSYNADLRQLLHVSFKIAARMGERFTSAVKENEKLISRGVTQNLFERHIRPVFFTD